MLIFFFVNNPKLIITIYQKKYFNPMEYESLSFTHCTHNFSLLVQDTSKMIMTFSSIIFSKYRLCLYKIV